MNLVRHNIKFPSNVRRKNLTKGRVAYYWEVPSKDRNAGCLLQNEALGQEIPHVLNRAEQLNTLLKEYRHSNESKEQDIHGTISWMLRKVEEHPKFIKTSKKTQKNYRDGFKLVENFILPKSKARLGDVPVLTILPRHADIVYESLKWVEETKDGKIVKRKRLSMANTAMRAMRRAYNIAYRAGWTFDKEINPFSKMGLEGEDGELVPGLFDRLINTPRTGNLIIMRDKLDKKRKKILPYEESWFQHELRKIANAAELPADFQFRALRHGGLTELGDSEATEQELQSIGGHKSREILSDYVRVSEKQALNASRKRRKLILTEEVD